MRKTHKLLVAVVAMVTAVFMIGCSSGLTVISTESSDVVLTGNITNYSDFVAESKENSSARTIMPSAETLGGLAWWLVYNEVGQTTKTYVKVSDNGNIALGANGSGSEGTTLTTNDLTALTDGSFKINLQRKAYQLNLYAVTADSTYDKKYQLSANHADLAKNAIIRGTSYIDLRNDSGSANFTMTSNNLEGTALAQFNVVLDKWGEKPVGKVEMEIRDFLTNEEVKTGDSPAATTKVTVEKIGWTQGTAENYGVTSYYVEYKKLLKSGIYNFFVTFYDEHNKKLFVWSDNMVVLPNRPLTEPVYISDSNPKKPEAPLYFMASYLPASLNPVEEDYEVYFEWTDQSNLEEYFVLEVINCDADDPSAAAQLYAGLDTNFINGNIGDIGGANKDNAAWDNFVDQNTAPVTVFDPHINPVQNYSMYYDTGVNPNDGGLWANNTKITLTLQMGHRYLARIKAVNSAGDSPYTYVDLAAFNTKDSDGSRKAYAPDASDETSHKPLNAAFNSDTINIYKIVYHLNGGRYVKTGETVTDPYDSAEANNYTTDDFVVYNIQDKTPRGGVAPTTDATALDYWDGFHIFEDSNSSPVAMKSKSTDFGGKLKKDDTAKDAEDDNGTNAKDEALLGGLWDDFDTNGDLKYHGLDDTNDPKTYYRDVNFGKGSLQRVEETNYHNTSNSDFRDIAAFLYWVDDPTKDPTPAAIKAQTSKYNISTGYKGFKNVELWAKYQPINDPIPAMTAYARYDDPTQYNINNQWITYKQSKTGTVAAVDDELDDKETASHALLSKYEGVYLHLALTVPKVVYVTNSDYTDTDNAPANKESFRKTEAYVLTSAYSTSNHNATDAAAISPADYAALSATDKANYTKVDWVYSLPKGVKYDSVRAIAYKPTGYEAGWSFKAAGPEAGSALTFDKIDISNWNKGQNYRVVVEAKYGKYSYKTSATFLITD